MLQNVNKKACCADKQSLDFSGAYVFHFAAEKSENFFVKHTLNEDYREINVLKKGRPGPFHTLYEIVKKRYIEPIKIAANKLANVRSLLPYIPAIYHPFYDKLSAAIQLENSDEDIEILDE